MLMLPNEIAMAGKSTSLRDPVPVVLDFLAVLPLGHPLMMLSAARLITDPIGISDRKVRYFIYLAEVDYLAVPVCRISRIRRSARSAERFRTRLS
jgi:hypothetical protein